MIIIIIFIIYWGVTAYQNKEQKISRKNISNSFHHAQLDNTEEKTVSCNDMPAPKIETKYAYSFNLIINDFYCNKGKWKCLMLKGIDMSNYEPQDCSVFEKDKLVNINRNITPEQCFEYVCKKEYDELNLTEHNQDLEEKVEPEDLNKRVDLICRATKMGEEGKILA